MAFGKFLGTAATLSSSILVGFGFSGLMIGWYLGTEQLGGFLPLFGWALLFGVGQLSVGFLISVFAPNSAKALGIAIFIRLFIVFFSDLTLMSAFLLWRFPVQTLFWLSLTNPAQVFKISSIHTLQGNLELIGEAGLYARDIPGDQILTVLSAILVAWVLLPLSISLWLFGRRKGQ
ncbi:MAG: ABC transporter permease subunit [Candidatus Fervidibacter sp.]|uniref:ABC transporter permease subunit n=1 Tax=Candidatus Fervidibacter sp. TaxID=3100871 RepID=UPI0040498E7A